MKKISALRLLCLCAVFSTCLFSLEAQRTEAQTLVNFQTNFGDIEIELFDNTAPNTVANFLGYVNRGDYDGTIIHRSVPNFVIQGGGFFPDQTPIDVQDPIDDEFGASNIRGTIAMARTNLPNSATSQFFFNTTDNSSNLDNQNGGFTVFGMVTSGLDLVDSIQALDTFDLDDNGSTFDNVPLVNGDTFVGLISVSVVSAVPEPTAAVAIVMCGVFATTRRPQTLVNVSEMLMLDPKHSPHPS